MELKWQEGIVKGTGCSDDTAFVVGVMFYQTPAREANDLGGNNIRGKCLHIPIQFYLAATII